MQGLDWGAVAALYVVGGASALPLIPRLLRERYGRKVRTSPYPHAATAIGLALAADQDAGYQLHERFTRHFGVWREAEDGHAIAFDVVFAKDMLPAPGEALSYAHAGIGRRTTSGIFATSNAASSPTLGTQPAISRRGTKSIFRLRCPCTRQATCPQSRSHASSREAPWIEERYTCDAHGIIAVEMQNQTCHYARRYQLRGSAARDPGGRVTRHVTASQSAAAMAAGWLQRHQPQDL